jgi:putative endonuclease
MRDEYIYYVYMMQSASRRALYIGMTNNLRKRVWQHKNHIWEGFTDDYNCTRLVYWQSFDDVARAIDREKQLKRWRREKKNVFDRTQERRMEGFSSRLVPNRNTRSLDCGACSLA